uniref:IS110 family transposase n=1 Tax=Vallitalea okinawensis TaxID=2078660 RepID=UPI0013003F3A
MNNPTLCIDVAKNKSVARAFLPGNQSFSKPFTFKHTLTDINQTSTILEQLKTKTGTIPDIVLEATGSYSKPLVRYFHSSGYQVVQLNPLQTGIQKRRSLRKIKTDPIDTSRIASVYYLEDCSFYEPSNDKFDALRKLSRHYYSLNESYTEVLQKYLSVLDLIFPNLRSVFYSLHSKTVLTLLDTFPSITEIIRAPKQAVIDILRLSTRSMQWCEDKYVLLIAAAKEALYDDSSQLTQSYILKTYISLIRHFS